MVVLGVAYWRALTETWESSSHVRGNGAWKDYRKDTLPGQARPRAPSFWSLCQVALRGWIGGRERILWLESTLYKTPPTFLNGGVADDARRGQETGLVEAGFRGTQGKNKYCGGARMEGQKNKP